MNCKAVQFSDQMYCVCGNAWDINDTTPPACRTGSPLDQPLPPAPNADRPASGTTGARNALETQVGGDHYRNGGIQPVEYIESNKLGFCEGNVIKYITRHQHKGGRQDLEKARHYIDLLIEIRYGGG